MIFFDRSQGIPLPPPKAFWIGVSEHEKDRCYEERWRVLRRVPQGVHALAAAHPHPGSGTGVSVNTHTHTQRPKPALPIEI